jgi:hypothetical protein
VVPCPHFPDDPHLALQGRQRKPGPTRFYHIGKWEPRKAQDRILEAFLLAFRPGQAFLSLRSSGLDHPVVAFPQSPHEALAKLIDRSDVRANGWTSTNVMRSVRLYVQRLSEDQLMILHREGDVYVTLSRGEGFDMPAMDAKLSGNLLLYTPSGGPQDFAGDRDVLVPQTGMVRAHEMYEWQDTEYIDYSIDSAVAGMQLAARRAEVHDRAPHVDLAPFTAASVGARMRRYLDELREDAEPVNAAHRQWVERRGAELRRAMEASAAEQNKA